MSKKKDYSKTIKKSKQGDKRTTEKDTIMGFIHKGSVASVANKELSLS